MSWRAAALVQGRSLTRDSCMKASVGCLLKEKLEKGIGNKWKIPVQWYKFSMCV